MPRGPGSRAARSVRQATSTLDGVRAPTIDERDAQLRWLLLLRVAIATAVLPVTMYLQFLEATASLQPLFGVAGAVYGVSILWALLHDRLLTWDPFAGLQLSVDVALATLLIFLMGGVQSPFVVLYLMIVAAAGLMLTRRGASYIAALTVVCYGLVGLAAYGPAALVERLPGSFQEAVRNGLAGEPVQASELYLRLFALLLVVSAMTWLSFNLSSRLRRAGTMLRTRQAQLRALRRLHERIVQGMSGGLVATDAAGVIVTANRAAAEITGRSVESLIGTEVWRLFGDDPADLQRLDERLDDDRVYRSDRNIQVADGTWKTIGMTASRPGRTRRTGRTPCWCSCSGI